MCAALQKKSSPGLFSGAPTEYRLVQLLSAEGEELPVDRETKFFNGLVPLAEDLLVLVKLENAEKCDPLLDLLLLLLNSVEGSYHAMIWGVNLRSTQYSNSLPI